MNTRVTSLKIETIDTNHKSLGELSYRVAVDDHGVRLVVEGHNSFYPTGKLGTNRATGKAMVEMATDDDERLWIAADLTLITLD